MARPAERGEDLDLYGQLLRESVGMAKYALSGGKAIPAAVAETIEAATENLELERKPVASDSKAPGSGPAEGTPEGADASSQRAVPSSQGRGIRKLVAVHAGLSQIVAPATPQAILLLASHGAGSSVWSFLGPVVLVRRMMLAAIASLAMFMGMALFPEVTGDISFQNASSEELLFNLMFLLAAAGLGASFAALFTVNRFIAEARYDPKFETSYWITFALGLIAGIILAQLVPIGETLGLVPIGETLEGEAAGPAAATSLAAAQREQHTGIGRLAKPTLALLGGFSSALVYRILDRLVAAVDTLVRGETREIVSAQAQAAKARLAEQGARNRLETISRLVALQQQLADGAPTESLRERISEILSDVMDTDLSAGVTAGAKAAKAAGAASADRGADA